MTALSDPIFEPGDLVVGYTRTWLGIYLGPEPSAGLHVVAWLIEPPSIERYTTINWLRHA